MQDKATTCESFDELKTRLEEIVQAVSDETLPLDAALDLYEEAVSLGMRASDFLEDGITLDEEPAAEEAKERLEAAGETAGEAAAETIE